MTHVKTEIIHVNGGMNIAHYPDPWKPLCWGHDDSKLSGGMFYYLGDKVEAQDMADKRMADAVQRSNCYYSQPWI